MRFTYYPNSDEGKPAEYYKAIGDATQLPLQVYSRDGVNPSPAGVERLAGQITNLAARKDGQGDIRRYQQIMSRVGNRLHWIGGAGNDCVPGYYSIGIRHLHVEHRHSLPKLSLLLHEAASAPHRANLTQLMRDYVIPLYALSARRKKLEVSVMKEIMNQLGMAAGPVRPPLPHLRAENIADVKKLVASWTVILSLPWEGNICRVPGWVRPEMMKVRNTETDGVLSPECSACLMLYRTRVQ